ncbi:MAG: hypothetical protein P8X42_03415 [Calditrichaceae bacterium]
MNKVKTPINILQTTIGYESLLEVLKEILTEINEEDKLKINTYEQYFKRVLNEKFIINERYISSLKSSGLEKLIIEKIEHLKGQEYGTEQEFINDIRKSYPSEKLDAHKAELLKNAVFKINFRNTERYPYTSRSRIVFFEDLKEKIWG